MNPTRKLAAAAGMFAIGIASTADASQFCAGFEHGFASGHMQASGSSLPPLSPLCPLQPLKRLNDPDSDYEHGYIIGLNKGYQKGSRRRY